MTSSAKVLGISPKKSKIAVPMIIDGDNLVAIGVNYYSSQSEIFDFFQKNGSNDFDISKQSKHSTLTLMHGLTQLKVNLNSIQRIYDSYCIVFNQQVEDSGNNKIVLEEMANTNNRWTNELSLFVQGYIEIEKNSVVTLVNSLIENKLEKDGDNVIIEGIIKKIGDKIYFSLDI
jgi:hypothetical protein